MQAVDLTFTGLAIDAVGKLPGVSGLRGELRGDADAFSLELPAQSTTLQFPQIFRQPFSLTSLSGTLAFWPDNGDWHIGVDALDFAGAGYAGDARGEGHPAGAERPFLDIYAGLDHVDLQAAKAYLPTNTLPPATVAWLDNALVEGRIDQAQALVRGSLADWPFRHNEGRFEARAPVMGLVFDYGKGWPRGEGLDLVASFVNNGLSAEATAGQVLGVKVDHAAAQIPDFADPVLDLSVQGQRQRRESDGVRAQKPDRQRSGRYAGQAQSGRQRRGRFPSGAAAGQTERGTGERYGAIEGRRPYRARVEPQARQDQRPPALRRARHAGWPVDVGFRGQPSKLQLAIAGGNADPGTTFRHSLSGSYQLSELVQDYPTLKWLVPLADGRSDFAIGFTVAHSAAVKD